MRALIWIAALGVLVVLFCLRSGSGDEEAVNTGPDREATQVDGGVMGVDQLGTGGSHPGQPTQQKDVTEGRHGPVQVN